MPNDKLKKLAEVFQLLQHDTITPKELEGFLTYVLKFIKESKENFEGISTKSLAQIKEAITYIREQHADILLEVDSRNASAAQDFESKMAEVDRQIQELKSIEIKDGKDGADGKDADEELIIDEVLKKIPAQEKETGDSIVEKINSLDADGEKIDASHIKNLPKPEKMLAGGARFLSQLQDVKLTSLANNDVIKWNSTTLQFENGSGGGAGSIDGSGTANELSYWVDSDTLGSLAVATYPSLTEVSYLKGVTSGIQGQLNGKAAALGADDNYVTDAEKVVIGNTSGTNTGDQTSIVGITGTKAQFDTACTDGNFLFVGDVTSNATHTGEVTGSGALTVDKTAITGKTEVTAVGTDYILISDTSDSGNLKKALASDLIGAGGSGITRVVQTKSADATAGSTSLTDYVYFVTGTTTITLPTAVGNTNRYTVKSVSGVTTVAADGAETIDGSSSIIIAVEDSVDLVSNNTEWKVV